MRSRRWASPLRCWSTSFESTPVIRRGTKPPSPSIWRRSSRRWVSRDRKSTRLNSSHTVISPLSLHDALPILLKSRVLLFCVTALLSIIAAVRVTDAQPAMGLTTALLVDLIRIDTSNPPGHEAAIAEYLAPKFKALGFERSEEHTSELQSHSDLPSFPTRRSSDLAEEPRPVVLRDGPAFNHRCCTRHRCAAGDGPHHCAAGRPHSNRHQ